MFQYFTFLNKLTFQCLILFSYLLIIKSSRTSLSILIQSWFFHSNKGMFFWRCRDKYDGFGNSWLIILPFNNKLSFIFPWMKHRVRNYFNAIPPLIQFFLNECLKQGFWAATSAAFLSQLVDTHILLFLSLQIVNQKSI